MKVGTDAVLLGAWLTIENAKTILEVGSGSGVISLMLAQRTLPDTKITGIEIERDDAEQASENVIRSPWPEKVKIVHQSFQEFSSSQKFDLLVSNPPYFINSYPPPTVKRSIARHTNTLSYPELIVKAKQMLSPAGRFAAILPFEEGNYFKLLAKENGLHIIRQLAFYSRQGKSLERWLFEFAFAPKQFVTETLILHGKGEDWSDDYKNLTRDFYFKL